ncbi:MAG: ABZJ_00895 family protein [Pseudomonadota bacterium]
MSVNLTRYGMWFAGTSLVLLTLALLVRMAFDVQIGTAFVPIIPAMVGAMIEGSKWAKSNREAFAHPWRDALAMTAVAVALTALSVIMTTVSAQPIGLEWIGTLGILLLVYAVFWLITNRIFLGMGARNEWAAQDRRGS